MIKFRHVIIFSVICGLVAVGGCKKASNEEIQDAISGAKSVYKGFFDLLIAKKGNPAGGVAAGEKFVEDSKAKLLGYGKVIGNRSFSQQEMLNKYQTDITQMSSDAGKKLGPFYGRNANIRNKLGELTEKIGLYIAEGAGETDGSKSSAAIGPIKKTFLMTAGTMKGQPDAAKKQVVDQAVQAIKDSGADQAEQDAFEKEMKEKIGL